VGTPTTAARRTAIHVLATTFEATRAALSAAVPLAKGLARGLVVIVPKVVSYALPLDEPVDSTEFMVSRYRDLIADFDGDAQVRLCVCRRVADIVRQLLPAGTTIVIGGRARRWLPSEEMRLVRRLTELGHHVVFVPMPAKQVASRINAPSAFAPVDAKRIGVARGR
jgi:hypothetical protein